MKNRNYHPAKQFVEEARKLELKDLPPHLSYVFLGKSKTLLVIIAADLNGPQVHYLVSVFKRFKQDIGWTVEDIIWILPIFFLKKSNSFKITSLISSIGKY